MRETQKMPLVLALAAAAVLLAVSLDPAGADSKPPQPKVWIGPYDIQLGCIKCHESEVKAWQETTHGRDVHWLDRQTSATDYLDKLGLGGRLPTEVGLCRSCHATTFDDGGLLARAVSCERCHGPAGKWIGSHCDYRDSSGMRLSYSERASEGAGQRSARIAKSRSAGMIRSDMLYDIAARCLSCHALEVDPAQSGGITAQALLKAGHKFGDAEFELVTYTQGEVRHNFLHGGANQAPYGHTLSERVRTLYVAGAMVDLERSLARLGACSEDDKDLWKALRKRLKGAEKQLEGIVEALGTGGVVAQELAATLAALPDVKTNPRDLDQVASGAADVSARVRRLLSDTGWVGAVASSSALDSGVIPKPEAYVRGNQ